MGGEGPGACHPLAPLHQARHAGTVRPAVPLRRVVPVRAPLRRHAGGPPGGGAQAVDRSAVARPRQDRLRHRQEPLLQRLLHHGAHSY